MSRIEPAAQSFHYKPLDVEIDSLRILILHPRGEEIHCSLEHRTFASKPVYETLSYTWGSAGVSHTIFVDGQPFPVRKNLYDALTHLQQAEPRNIWVDAICIDQSNIAERNYQVNLMSFVYSRASNALIWLNCILKKYPSMRQDDPPTTRRRMMMSMDENQAAVADLPYFTRVWVIQEYILPKEIKFLLDEFVLSEQEFYNMITDIRRKSFEMTLRTLKEHREKRHKEEFRLEKLIQTFRGAKCTETRDKIFGFLGLAHDNDLDADYNMGYLELYTTLINFHQDSEAELEDWRTANAYDRAAKLMHFSELIQETLEGEVDDERLINATLPDETRVFTAKGATVSRILHLGPTYDEVISSMDAEKAWRQARQIYYGTYEELPDVLAADKKFTRSLLTWNEQRVRSVRGVTPTDCHAYRLEPCTDSLSIRAAYTNISDKPSPPRRFLGTRGCFGMAPAEAQVGDALASFVDCHAFIVLRPIDKDCWMIVGKAMGETFQSRGQPQFYVPDAVQDELDSYSRSYLQEGKWDQGEGSFDGRRNVINLCLNLDILQQLTA